MNGSPRSLKPVVLRKPNTEKSERIERYVVMAVLNGDKP
jgi:hypothetical protein